MPIHHGTLTIPDGPVVTVRIVPTRKDMAYRRRARQPLPAPQEVVALIDTGAEISRIDPPVASRLQLVPKQFGTVNVPAVGGIGYSTFYEVELIIPHLTALPAQLLVIPDLLVAEVALNTFGYDAVIGRDVLAYCILVYDGPAGAFVLTY
jgi:hypothetical protein